MKYISLYAVPFMVVLIVAFGAYKKINVYSAFTDGIGNGIGAVFSILPPIMALFCAVGVFRASGVMDFVSDIISPVTDFFHIPKNLVPFSLLRPISGSGSLALANDIFLQEGVDSFSSKAVSVMMGSTETTFYTLAVYFGAVNIKNTRYALYGGLFSDFICFVATLLVCHFLF